MFSVLIFINCSGFADKEALFTLDTAARGKATLETHCVRVRVRACAPWVCVLVTLS